MDPFKGTLKKAQGFFIRFLHSQPEPVDLRTEELKPLQGMPRLWEGTSLVEGFSFLFFFYRGFKVSSVSMGFFGRISWRFCRFLEGLRGRADLILALQAS